MADTAVANETFDITGVFYGAAEWFVGMLYVLIMAYILPPVMNGLGAIFDIGDFARGVIWIGAIIIAVIISIILPVYTISKALEGAQENLGTTLQAILFFIFGIIFVYATYTQIGQLSQIMNVDGFTYYLFWISMIITWGFAILGAPATLIIKSMNQSDQ